MKRLRIAQIAPVATALPPSGSGSVELVTWLLTEGLVRRGHDVTLFATGDTTTSARLSAAYPRGYWHDTTMWPWELYEMLNLASAVERASEFDVIHFQAAYYPLSLGFARLSQVPLLQTLHHSPSPEEVRLWSRYPEARPQADFGGAHPTRWIRGRERSNVQRPQAQWVDDLAAELDQLHRRARACRSILPLFVRGRWSWTTMCRGTL